MKESDSQENVHQSPIEYDSWSYKKSLEIYKEDPFAMSNFLKFEGWQENILLPPGWKFRQGLGPAIELLSSEEQTFPTLSSSLKYIKAHYPENEVNNFKGFINPKTRNPSQLLEEDTNAQKNMTEISGKIVVPDKEPMIIHCDEQTENEVDSTDDLSQFESKFNTKDENQTLNSKFKMPENVSKSVTITYVANIVKTVSPEKEAEVKPNPNNYKTRNDTVTLPTGWKVEAKGIISPNGQLYKRKRNALEDLLKTGGSQEAIRAIRSLLVEEGLRMENLPGGWMGKTVHPAGFNFIASDGVFFDNKKSAMNHLIQLDGDLKDQQLLEQFKDLTKKDDKQRDFMSWSKPPTQYLGELRKGEGNMDCWEESPLLPHGWKLRAGKLHLRAASGRSFTSHQVLSPQSPNLASGNHEHFIQEAAKYMKDKGSYSDKDIQKLYQVEFHLHVSYATLK